jgi:hypothetical protein
MIEKVSHLVKITHDPAAPKLPRVAPVYDEAADAALMRTLAFDGKNIVLESYSEAELAKIGASAGSLPQFSMPRGRRAANARPVPDGQVPLPKRSLVQ